MTVDKVILTTTRSEIIKHIRFDSHLFPLKFINQIAKLASFQF